MSTRRLAAVAASPSEEAPAAPVASARRPLAAAISGRATLVVRRLLAFGAGALLACAFAPVEWGPLAIFCPAVLMWLWEDEAPRDAAWTGFWFSFGTFLAGTYWIYFSVHVLGKAPVWLTIAIMLGLIGIMALSNAHIGYAVARCLPRRGIADERVVKGHDPDQAQHDGDGQPYWRLAEDVDAEIDPVSAGEEGAEAEPESGPRRVPRRLVLPQPHQHRRTEDGERPPFDWREGACKQGTGAEGQQPAHDERRATGNSRCQRPPGRRDGGGRGFLARGSGNGSEASGAHGWDSPCSDWVW